MTDPSPSVQEKGSNLAGRMHEAQTAWSVDDMHEAQTAHARRKVHFPRAGGQTAAESVTSCQRAVAPTTA